MKLQSWLMKLLKRVEKLNIKSRIERLEKLIDALGGPTMPKLPEVKSASNTISSKTELLAKRIQTLEPFVREEIRQREEAQRLRELEATRQLEVERNAMKPGYFNNPNASFSPRLSRSQVVKQQKELAKQRRTYLGSAYIGMAGIAAQSYRSLPSIPLTPIQRYARSFARYDGYIRSIQAQQAMHLRMHSLHGLRMLPMMQRRMF